MLAATTRWPSLALSRFPALQRRSLSYKGKEADPLRILFCGSDEFSIASLKRLHEAHLQDEGFVESIHVFAKEGKRAGRDLKTIREVPIVNEAQQLSIPLHQASTFTGWEPPSHSQSPFNLVIAVSFGLLVPPRILRGMKYGGLNLHPSLLPELRGPAPLHHTILQGKDVSGITLQTLHEKHFDRGLILAQEEFAVPRPNSCTFEELRDAIAPVAADFLTQQLRQLVFIDAEPIQSTATESSAYKLDPSAAHVDWNTWTLDYTMRAERAMGSVWSMVEFPTKQGPRERRIKLHGLKPYQTNSLESSQALRPGYIGSVSADAENEWTPVIKTADGQLVAPTMITVDGSLGPKASGLALKKAWFEGRNLT